MSQSIFTLQDINFEADQKKILQHISFTVKQGELLTITGPSGSGKSTLLKIIATLLSETSGKILFHDKDIKQYEPTEYRKLVSYCFQTPSLFGDTVQDNLSFPYEIRHQEFDQNRAVQLLERVGLDASYLDKSIHDISGGEKQRIALIRNLLFETDVLLLDEVTSALDHENSQIIRELIFQLNQEENITVLWVTHNPDEFKEGTHQIKMVEGQIEEEHHE